MDAFFVAFKIPNFMRRLFAEGAFSQAFVPVISEYQEQRTGTAVQRTGRPGGRAPWVSCLLGITVVGVVASPVLVCLFAPGFLRDAGASST